MTKLGQTESNRVEMSGLVDTLIRLSGKTYPAKLHLTFDAVPECIQSLKMRNKETNRDWAGIFGNKRDEYR